MMSLTDWGSVDTDVCQTFATESWFCLRNKNDDALSRQYGAQLWQWLRWLATKETLWAVKSMESAYFNHMLNILPFWSNVQVVLWFSASPWMIIMLSQFKFLLIRISLPESMTAPLNYQKFSSVLYFQDVGYSKYSVKSSQQKNFFIWLYLCHVTPNEGRKEEGKDRDVFVM